MNTKYNGMTRRIGGPRAAAKALAAVFALGGLLAVSVQAEEMFRPVRAPGGINVQSNTIITSTTPTNGNIKLTFQGLQAPYQAQISPVGSAGPWTNVAYTSVQYPANDGSVTVSNPPGNSQFRMCMVGLTNYGGRHVNPTNLVNINNIFVGAARCNGCHGDKVAEWSETAHASALSALQDTNGVISVSNQNYVVYRSVGYGQPGGFVNPVSTPQLANVGCEACHGPGSAHINISGRQYHPAVTLSPALCGGCHGTADMPTYNEYAESGHIEVTPDVSYGVSSGTFVPNTIVGVPPLLTNVIRTTNIIVGVSTNYTTNAVFVMTNYWYGYILGTNGTTNAAAGIVNSLGTVAGVTSGYGRQMSCGPCHSAATRAAMLQDYEARQNGVTNYLALPSAIDGAEWGPSCATCHDPHAADNPYQLRNPKRSTGYYTFFTGSVMATNFSTNVYWSTDQYTYVNGVDAVVTPGIVETNVSTYLNYRNEFFAAQYNPNIQVCGQCHNSRGARWDGIGRQWDYTNSQIIASAPSFSRPPHHSPQYNLLIGIVQDDYLNKSSNITSPHFSVSPTSGNTNQCIACHVPIYAAGTSNVTGHTFNLDVKGCALAGCHTAYTELGLHTKVEERQETASNNLARVVSLLNQWGLTKAPAVLRTNYGALAWEYTAPGVLGNPSGSTSIVGPSSSQQSSIPDVIKKARFNLYMVQHDGSMGVHNVTYSDFLIRDAETNATSQFPLANFTARTATAGYAPLTVAFTNFGTVGTTYSWTFGDGVGTSTAANPSYTYTSPGIYSVTCTANGTETMTRTNYIVVPIKPVVSFTGGPTTVALGTPVTFTNTSTSISDVGLWRWTPNLTNSATAIDTGYTPTFTYTYTNTGTFSVSLRATTAVGSSGRISATNFAYITVTP
jgi:PKD repeat protein